MVESGGARGAARECARIADATFGNSGAPKTGGGGALATGFSEATLERAVLALIVTLGVLARYRYAFGLNAARHHVNSDAGEVIALARRFADPLASQTIADTIWPPGAAALLAPLVALDPSLGVAALAQFLASCATFLLVGYCAWLAAGRRAGQLATLFAALHFGFIHYTGVFLSEQFFQLAIALALTVSVLVLRRTEAHAERGSRVRGARLRLLGLGGLVGACWACSAMLRPNALPVALVTGAVLLVHTLRRGERFRLYLLAGGLFAFLALLAPLSQRCSKLSGHFCAVSNNVAMNVALGQAGEVKGLEFRDAAKPELTTSWVPPALLHHGYDGMGSVTRAIYDTPGLFAWVFQRLKQDPGMFLVRAAGNALDLFRIEYWPDDYGRLPVRTATVAKQAFLLCVVAPGLILLVQLVVKHLRAPGTSVLSLALVAVFGSVLLSAALSMGEPRYRIPFDSVLIVLAATMYTRSEETLLGHGEAPRGSGFVLASASLLSVLLALSVIAVSHPTLRAASRMELDALTASARRNETLLAKDFNRVAAAGSRWDAPGNHRFACSPNCAELTLSFDGTKRDAAHEIVLDHNDAYQVRFLSNGRELGSVVVPPRASSGMRVARVATPKSAQSGFDQIALLPLYGDGRYSVAAVRPSAE
jgi:hypothetical protein